jgi:hypothetical protein
VRLTGKDSLKTPSLLTLCSAVVRRVERRFKRDRPANTHVAPSQGGELSITPRTDDLPTCAPKSETGESAEGSSLPPEFMAMVHSLEVRFTAEPSTSAGGEPTDEPGDPSPAPDTALTAERLELPYDLIAVGSGPPAVKGSAVSSVVGSDTESSLKAPPQFPAEAGPGLRQLHPDIAALSREFDSERRRFITETQQQLEHLRTSGQALVDDIQKQLAAAVNSSVEAFVKAAAAKARGEIGAAKHNVLADTKAQLVSMSPSALEGLTNDVLEQIRSKFAASNQALIEDAQNQLTKMTQASLEPLVKATVEQGHKELNLMLKEFFADGGQKIEAKRGALLSWHGDEVRPPAPRAPSADTRLAQLHPLPIHDEREFTLAEIVRKRRLDLPAVLAGLASGAKLGLASGGILLLLLAIYVASSPVIRLRATPPLAFFDESPSWTAKQRARENQLARAYWDLAVRDIEEQYGFGTTLPLDPPDNFKVEEKGRFGDVSKVDPAARNRYWERLREVWPLPDSWERMPGWSRWLPDH